MIWFTSDTHFAHANILVYCNRPFENVDLMNTTLVDRWNERVESKDTVYHLGDFAMGPRERVPEFVNLLRGRIVLIRGNHDKSAKSLKNQGFAEVHEHLEIELLGHQIWLSHKPVDELKADINLHGHVHNHYRRRGRHINVGVDVRDFRPASFEELFLEVSE